MGSKSEIMSLSRMTNDNNLINSTDMLLPFAVQAAFQKLNVSHAISFHSMNSRAQDFVEISKHVFDNSISLFHVNGKMPAAKREEVLIAAKQTPKSIISNCRLLATGVDEADWDLVVLADPVRSQVLSRQMIGRVSRKAPMKQRGYVLVPMVVDNIDFEDIVESDTYGYGIFTSAFDAMIGLDPELRQDVLFVAEETKRLGHTLVDYEFPSYLRDAFMLPDSLSLEKKNEIMNRAILEYTGRNTWNQMYELLENYKSREGNCNVPKRHKENGVNLGEWLGTQRERKKAENIDSSYTKRLEEIGVVWDLRLEQWNHMYELLNDYKLREGDCNVPQNHEENGMNLGTWLNTQRDDKKNGNIDSSYAERLEDIGVVWDVLLDKWNQKYELLKEYKRREMMQPSVSFVTPRSSMGVLLWPHSLDIAFSQTLSSHGTKH